jgi:hypothetical protein
MSSGTGSALKRLLLFLATLLVLYVGGFLFLHYTGLLDLAASGPHPQTDVWLYRLFKPLENLWPW